MPVGERRSCDETLVMLLPAYDKAAEDAYEPFRSPADEVDEMELWDGCKVAARLAERWAVRRGSLPLPSECSEALSSWAASRSSDDGFLFIPPPRRRSGEYRSRLRGLAVAEAVVLVLGGGGRSSRRSCRIRPVSSMGKSEAASAKRAWS